MHGDGIFPGLGTLTSVRFRDGSKDGMGVIWINNLCYGFSFFICFFCLWMAKLLYQSMTREENDGTFHRSGKIRSDSFVSVFCWAAMDGMFQYGETG
jgi:hypothetical protein